MKRSYLLIAAGLLAAAFQSGPALADGVPEFKVDPFWPKPLPENWMLGQVSGIAVDKDDRIWIVHRPGTLVDDEKGALANPPATKCCKPAPPVLQFDAQGNLLKSWAARVRATTGPRASTASTSTGRATSGSPATGRRTSRSSSSRRTASSSASSA